MFFTCKRTIISILVMRGMCILLIEMGMWLTALTGGNAGDSTGDPRDNEANRITSRHVAANALDILKTFHFNSGDVRYARSDDRDRYMAGGAPG
jgi:hypothetical protein